MTTPRPEEGGGSGGELGESGADHPGGMGGEIPEGSEAPLTSGDPAGGKVGVRSTPAGTEENVPPPMTHQGSPD